MVVTGSQQALEISARVLLDPRDAVWIEEPSYPGARQVSLDQELALFLSQLMARGWMSKQAFVAVVLRARRTSLRRINIRWV